MVSKRIWELTQQIMEDQNDLTIPAGHDRRILKIQLRDITAESFNNLSASEKVTILEVYEKIIRKYGVCMPAIKQINIGKDIATCYTKNFGNNISSEFTQLFGILENFDHEKDYYNFNLLSELEMCATAKERESAVMVDHLMKFSWYCFLKSQPGGDKIKSWADVVVPTIEEYCKIIAEMITRCFKKVEKYGIQNNGSAKFDAEVAKLKGLVENISEIKAVLDIDNASEIRASVTC